MKQVLVLLVLAGMTLVSCGGGNEYTTPPEGNVPEHEIVSQSPGPAGENAPQFNVDTEATGEEDLRSISQQIRSDNADLDGIFINFYSPSAQSGSAVAANSEKASERIFAPQILSGFMSQATPEEIMEEQNGMLVVSVDDELDVMTEEICAEWDEGESGPPPPEWNCD